VLQVLEAGEKQVEDQTILVEKHEHCTHSPVKDCEGREADQEEVPVSLL